MKSIGLIALILVVVGAVNWGLVGLAQFDLVAALFGFTGIAGASFAVAKVLALIFAALFLVFLLLGLAGASRIAT